MSYLRLKSEVPHKQIRRYLDEIYPIPKKDSRTNLDVHFAQIDDIRLLEAYLQEAVSSSEQRAFWATGFSGALVVVIVGLVTTASALAAPLITGNTAHGLSSFSVGYYLLVTVAASSVAIFRGLEQSRRRVANVLIREAIQRRLSELNDG